MTEERNPNQFRQGDVWIERVTPESGYEPVGGWKKMERTDGRIVLALGEATGHSHTVEETDEELVQAFIDDLGFIKLSVKEPGATVTHQEHGPIALEPGDYIVARQREYDPDTAKTRYVAD